MSDPLRCPSDDQLRAVLDGQLTADQQTELALHLDTCNRCQRTLERLASGTKSWADLARQLREAPAADAPPSLLKQAVDKLGSQPPSLATTGQAPDAPDLSFLSPSDQPGQLGRLGFYAVLKLLGQGGMGMVFKALDPALERIVAIKVMAPQLAASATARQRFLREARAAAAVRHGHVVAIHAVDEVGRVPYIVMQFVPGISLQDRLDRSGALEVKEILRIGMQAAQGLAAARAQGLVHRDIKPANILLENGVEAVRITDFGLARAVNDASLTQSGVVAGTPMYMSPEQARGDAVDHRTDLFSLGSVLYVLCTGRPPFRAGNTMAVLKRVCDETPRPIRELRPEIPDALAAVISRLHAKEPAERHQSAKEVAEVLQRQLAALQQTGSVKPQSAEPTLEYRPEKPQRRRAGRQLLSLALLLLAVGLGVGGYFLWPKHTSQVNPPDKQGGLVKNPPVVPVIDKDGWRQLFNGRDLSGWTSREGGTANWTVAEGAITCSGGKDYLYSVRDNFGEFHLRAEVKINDTGNSGIYFRTGKPLQEIGDYEAQITLNPGQTNKTGSLYGLVPVPESPVPADTWFTYEIIAEGPHIRLLVDGKETASYTEPRPDRRARGYIALQHHDDVTQVRFRKIEIKEFPAGKQPFVILARDKKADERHPTLAAAVAAAQSGDTIEIRGNGPFETNPIVIDGVDLVIRAGAGFRPVVKLHQGTADTLLKTNARLVLEGLELQKVADPWQEGKNQVIVYGCNGGFFAANCRFQVQGSCGNIQVFPQDLEIINSEMICGWWHSLSGSVPSVGRWTVDNCVITGGTSGLSLQIARGERAPRDSSLRLTRNSFTGMGAPIEIRMYELPERPSDGKTVRIEASGNIFDGHVAGVLSLNQWLEKPVATAAEIDTLFSRLLGWGGKQNAFPEEVNWLQRGNKLGDLPDAVAVGTRAEWEKYWGLTGTDNLHGQARFEGGDLLERLKSEPHKLTARDFRLAQGSVGKGKGPAGTDLGANVDLVGPGEPYERWRKTPEYQKWLKTTGQSKAVER